MSNKSMFVELSRAAVEHEVQVVYEGGFKKSIPNLVIEHDINGSMNCKTDGYFEIQLPGKTRYVLTEYKYNKNLSDAYERAEVIIQTIYYINHLLKMGRQRPDVVFIGDKDEWFVMDVRKLEKFFTRNDINWDIAPSEAAEAEENVDFVLEVAGDSYVASLYVHTVDKNFSFQNVMTEIVNICKNIVPPKYAVDAKTITEAFDKFSNCINKHLESKELVKLFVKTLTEPESYHQDEVQKARLNTESGVLIPIHRLSFSSFAERYVKDYTEKERMALTEIADRIIADADRRKSGDFWTPTVFVNYSHERLEQVLGKDWRDKYVVWDCCCGTKNLTRDYVFKELYCSTLFKQELDMGSKYNPEGTSFQFDFLNDELKSVSEGGKVPDSLMNAIKKGKKLIFLINPPYATASVNSTELGKNKAGICQTMVNGMMSADKIGGCQENLLAQFLYRIMKIKQEYGIEVSIGLFCNPIFLSGSTYNKFREKFMKEFKYESGFLFNASHFSDTSPIWGINFSVWTSGETSNKDDFRHDLVDKDRMGAIVKVGEKDIYNLDNLTGIGKWLDVGVEREIEYPNFSSGVKVVQKSGKGCHDFLGSFSTGTNRVQYSGSTVCLSSGVMVLGHNTYIPINPSNFLRCISTFSARKLISSDWKNQKDEYLSPDETHPDFHAFEMDSVIYSLFHTSSQQTSLRDIDYHDKTWDVANEFFWMSRNDMVELAKQHGNDECLADATSGSEERFVYKFIQAHKGEFSKEALDVLDKACELVRESFKYRWMFNQDNPDYQTNNWDCGYYQLKGLLKDDKDASSDKHLNALYEDFKKSYQELADKMRPMVYELGFLKK